MAKEKLVTIHVHTPFTLTLGDQSKQEFGRGRHNVPEEVASHWFTQAHSELSESVISDTDDLQPIIDSLQAQIADKDKQIVDKDQLIADLKEALLKLLNMKSHRRLCTAQFLRSSQKGTLFHHGFKRNKTAQIHNPKPIENIESRI